MSRHSQGSQQGGRGAGGERGSPPTAAERAAQELQEQGRQQQLREAEARFIAQKDVKDFLSRIPDRSGSFFAPRWERLNVNPEYVKHKERIMLMIRNMTTAMNEAIQRRLQGGGKVREETREKLRGLDVGGHFKTAGYALNRDTTYGEAGSAPLSTEDVLALEQHVEAMSRMDVVDLVDMMFDNQYFIRMLSEESSDDYLKKSDGYTDSQTGERVSMLDPRHKRWDAEKKKWVPDYKDNMDRLYLFITGASVAGEKPKSEVRKLAERNLWREIVRSMDCEQKADLLAQFMTDPDVPEDQRVERTKRFIADCMITGAMSRRELLDIYNGEHKEHGEKYAQLFAELGEPEEFNQFLKDAIRAKGELRQQIDDMVRQVEEPQIENAATYYLTFNKSVAELVGRCAALGAIFSTALNIAGRFRSGHGKWYAKIIPSVAGGVKDSITDPRIVAEVAVAAAAAAYVDPRIKRWALYSPSGAEQEVINQERELKYLREQADNHHEVVNYFAGHYEEYIRIARLNENNDNPDQKSGETRGKFELYPGDIKLGRNPEEESVVAGQLGYSDPRQAKEVIQRMFGAFTRVFQYKDQPIATKDDLLGFLREKKIIPSRYSA